MITSSSQPGSDAVEPGWDRAPCGLLTFDLDRQAIRAINATLLDLLGYERSEIVGRPLGVLLSAAGRVFCQTHFLPLIQLHHRADEVYLSLRSQSGADIPVLVNAVQRDGRVECALVVMHRRNQYEDAILQARKEAEKATAALRSALTLQQAIFDSANHSIVSTDRTGIVKTFNRAAERMLGYAAAEVVGTASLLQFHDPEETQEAAVRLKAFLADAVAGRTLELECLTRRKDGWRVPVSLTITVLTDSGDRPSGFLCIGSDLTERKRMEQSVRSSERRLEDAQRVARTGSWEFDCVTKEVIWSTEMFRLLCLDPAHGVPVYPASLDLYHADDVATLTESVDRAMAIGLGYELDLRRTMPDGTVRWFHAVGNPIAGESGAITRLIGTLTDVTERKRLDLEQSIYLRTIEDQNAAMERQKQDLLEANRQLEALATTDGLTGLKNHRAFQEKAAQDVRRAHANRTPFSLLLLDVDWFKQYNDTFGHPEGDTVLKTVADILRANARATDFVARYGGEEFVVLAPDTDPAEVARIGERFRRAVETFPWTWRGVTISIGAASLGMGTETPPSLLDAADKALYASKKGGRNRVTHADGLAVGVVGAASASPVADLGLSVSTQVEVHRVAAALQSDPMLATAEALESTLQSAHDATISSWSRLLDMKDKETEGHSERVTAMTVRLAQRYGLDAKAVQYARWGALLHDIGKIGIPDSILLKPGPLTEDEWVVMRRHPVIADEMLSPIPFLRPALDIPRYHHEKWDGSGYPIGLRGEDIPISARLFAVVDVYDALRSDRPYRAGWDEARVQAYLRENSGTHFDPDVVAIFLALRADEADASTGSLPAPAPAPEAARPDRAAA